MTYAYTAIRRRLRLAPAAGEGAGGGTGGGTPPAGGDKGEGDDEGGDEGDDDEGDDDSDLEGADLSKLKETIKKERKAKREASRTARTLQQEKDKRDKAERDAATEAARKKGEFETVANDEKSRADAAEAALVRERIVNRAYLAAVSLNFVDPDDATRYLDFADIPVDAKGVPDKDEIDKRVKAIATAKKHLIKSDRAPGLPEPGQGQGSGSAKGAAQSYIAGRYGQKKAD